MSVYVGIDVHRKRSQVAVVAEDGTVRNKNVVNGSEPFLRLIGDLPAGTPVAFEAAFGWGWRAELLEDYGFEAHLVHPLRCKAIASARLKNDKGLRRDLDAAAARGPAARGAGSPRCRSASSAPWSGTGSAWSASAPGSATGSTRSPSATAMTGLPATGPARAAAGWPSWTCRAAPREIVTDCLAVTDGLAPLTGRLDGELHARAKDGPRVKVLRELPGVGEFTALVMLAEIGDIARSGSARKRRCLQSGPFWADRCLSTVSASEADWWSPAPGRWQGSRVHAAQFILYVADQARARDFYRRVLAAEPVLDVPGMTEFDLGGATLGLMPAADIEALLSGQADPRGRRPAMRALPSPRRCRGRAGPRRGRRRQATRRPAGPVVGRARRLPAGP